MKAWEANSKYSEGSVVVFAETASKAKQEAMKTEELCDEQYTDIRVNRLPKIDRFFKKGKTVVDWNEDEDIRLELVKEYNWYCLEPTYRDCSVCLAEKYCNYSLLEGTDETDKNDRA